MPDATSSESYVDGDELSTLSFPPVVVFCLDVVLLVDVFVIYQLFVDFSYCSCMLGSPLFCCSRGMGVASKCLGDNKAGSPQCDKQSINEATTPKHAL